MTKKFRKVRQVASFSSIILKQHNALTEARYEMSSLEKNIVYMLLYKLGLQGLHSKIYTFTIKEMESISGKSIETDELKAATHKLISRVYSIREDNGNLLQTAIISSAKYIEGVGIIELGVDTNVKPYLFDLRDKFTMFKLKDAFSLRSKYSKRFYEMLSQYQDTGIMYITVRELKFRLDLIDEENDCELYKNFDSFKRKTLDIAQKELLQSTNISFTYKAIKTGRKYTNLEFKISKKHDYKAIDLNNTLLDNDTEDKIKKAKLDLLNRFKMSDWQIKKIFDNVDPAEIFRTMYDIQMQLISGKLTNVGAYTAKVFDQKYNLELLHRAKYSEK